MKKLILAAFAAMLIFSGVSFNTAYAGGKLASKPAKEKTAKVNKTETTTTTTTTMTDKKSDMATSSEKKATMKKSHKMRHHHHKENKKDTK